MDKITIERETLLPCPFCGDDGDKGRQEVTQMIEGRNKFARITCRACGAMCPEENWNRRAALAAQPAEPTMDTVLRNAARRSATVIHPGRLAAQPAEPVTHDPAIRWNFDASDTHLLVCREDHDKGDKCEYKQLHPSEVLAIVNRLRISAIELTFRSAAQPAPAAVPPAELTWLFTHCRAIGMVEGSESGKWEHDIALFTQRQAERIRVLERLVIDAAYTLDKARIWNGMGWTYHPLHPIHYTPMRERLHNECDSIEAARAALEATR